MYIILAISAVLNPQLFILDGGLSKAGEGLRSRAQKRFSYYAFHAVKDTPFALAALGNNAAILGCAKEILWPSC